jgi:hypothetical protein
VFPSSQIEISKLALIPSPQTIMQVSVEVGEPPEHWYPGSIEHELLQPSPLIVLPSSHPIDENLIPSPQLSVHVVAGLLAIFVAQSNPASK